MNALRATDGLYIKDSFFLNKIYGVPYNKGNMLYIFLYSIFITYNTFTNIYHMSIIYLSLF